MNVLIDGIEYCPKTEIKPLDDERLKKALKQITAMRYFREDHKMMPNTWELLEILAPEVNKLTDKQAFDLFHHDDDSY